MTALIRTFGLFVPVSLVLTLWLWRQPSPRQRTAALLASLWNLAPLLVLHLLAAHFGWWRFEAEGGLFLGFPVDLYLGWVLLWGAIPALAFPQLHLAWVIAIMLILDLILMPAAWPVIQLGPGWLLGEAIGLGVCLLPAQQLARWTSDDRALPHRATLQVISFSSLLVWVLPTLILTLTGGSWEPLLARPFWLNSLIGQGLAIPAILGLSAVQEFAQRGRGTPVPYDPPKYLVSSGPYAYLANPMQVSMVLLLIGLGLWLENLGVIGAGLMAFIYSLGLAAWDEGRALQARYGGAWAAYRQAVRPWWPRWRPWHPTLRQPHLPISLADAAPASGRADVPMPLQIPGDVLAPPTVEPLPSPAVLYVSAECGPCSELGRWIQARQPIGLHLHPAEAHPTHTLVCLTYDPEDGSPAEAGVAALARALEHLHLGWAFLGWTLRLPLVRQMVQIIVDGVGGEPRAVRRYGRDDSPC